MVTILVRTVIVYVILIAIMRLMGKRQLGELEITELITTLLISEIASLPIENPSIPVINAVIPLVTILTLEVILSVILLKCPRLKNVASARPSILIRHGKVDQGELQRIRISIDELVSEIRQSGLASLTDVDYAILEQNGKISVIPRRSAMPPNAADLQQEVSEDGIVHILIGDGRRNRYNLELLGLDDAWLFEQLRAKHLAEQDVFFLGIDDGGKLYWVPREEKK